MLLEELCQYYRMFVPIPVWFRYLVGYGELDSVLGRTLGILLGLLYLILKVCKIFIFLSNCFAVILTGGLETHELAHF